jgi:hypothetical protein
MDFDNGTMMEIQENKEAAILWLQPLCNIREYESFSVKTEY